MKKIMSICLILVSVFAFSGFAHPPKKGVIKTVKTKENVYNVRFGFKFLDGSYSTSSYTDSPGFTATNLNSGSEYECQLPSSPGGVFLPYQLPGTIEGLAAGTYEFNAIRGQGNWVGYGNVTLTLSPELVGPDGYITVYIPIAWEE